MGIKPVIALISKVGEVQKVPKIYIAALCCIFLSFLREYERGALLKYHSENL